MTENTKNEESIPIVLDYRCKRCGAPFDREEVIRCTIELSEREQRFHHCLDGGVGIGELVGFHDRCRSTPGEGRMDLCGLFREGSGI